MSRLKRSQLYCMQHLTLCIDPPFPLSVDSGSPEGRELYRLVKCPVEFYENTLTILKLENFPRAFELFDFNGRKMLALCITRAIVDKVVIVPTADEV